MDQIHKTRNLIEKSLQERKVCSIIIFEHRLFIKRDTSALTITYASSYLKSFQNYFGSAFRIKLKKIVAGIPQGSALKLVLCLPVIFLNWNLATFAEDTAIMTVDKDREEAARLELKMAN